MLSAGIKTKGQLSKKCQRKSVITFLSISLNMWVVCSKEPTHYYDASFKVQIQCNNVLLDFSLTVKAAPYECVIRTSQP